MLARPNSMANTTNVPNGPSPSSSDSSEDEEVARKISQAVCDESIFRTSNHCDVTGKEKNGKHIQSTITSNGQGKQLQSPKSNRPQDKNDDEHDNIFQTTPEFRAYIAKQLSLMLERNLSKRLSVQVWHRPQAQTESESGIRLFRDSKTRCHNEKNQTRSVMAETSKVSSPIKTQKKRKLSSSSESSEDEKVKACVFTLSDIHQENERLAFLEKPETEDSSQANVSSHVAQKVNSGTTNKNSSDQVVAHNDNVNVKKKQKKKKKHKEQKREDTQAS